MQYRVHESCMTRCRQDSNCSIWLTIAETGLGLRLRASNAPAGWSVPAIHRLDSLDVQGSDIMTLRLVLPGLDHIYDQEPLKVRISRATAAMCSALSTQPEVLPLDICGSLPG